MQLSWTKVCPASKRNKIRSFSHLIIITLILWNNFLISRKSLSYNYSYLTSSIISPDVVNRKHTGWSNIRGPFSKPCPTCFALVMVDSRPNV